MIVYKQNKFLILVLCVLLIIFSSIFIVYIIYNMNSQSSYSSKQPVLLSSIEAEKKSLHIFDSPQIKVDILVPSKRNDGTTIKNTEFEEMRTEIATRFGGVTVLTPFNGTSIHNETRYDGVNNSGFYVVAQNTKENLEWFVNYKQILKDRLHQDRIFMTFSPTTIVP